MFFFFKKETSHDIVERWEERGFNKGIPAYLDICN